MLQKHFSSRSEQNGKKRFIWRYERGAGCKEHSTKDTGVGYDFYGKSDDILENAFNASEKIHTSILEDIVAGKFDFSSRTTVLADLVWLLAMRTEANRTMMAETFDQFFDEISQQSGSDDAKAFMVAQSATGFQEVMDEISALMPKEQFEALMSDPKWEKQFAELKEQYLDKINSGEIGKFLGAAAEHLKTEARVQNTVKNSHNNALQKLIEAGARSPSSKVPNAWGTVVSTDGDFVLGDACIFAVNVLGEVCTVIGNDNLKQVYFPVSPHLAVVGYFDESREVLHPDEILSTSISVSSRYVFGSKKTDALEELVDARLGTNSYMLKPEEIAATISSVWN